MDKYTLLLLLNLPFVIFGLLKTMLVYKQGQIANVGLLIRLVFWSLIFAGLLFAREIYDYLTTNNLTDSGPLSIADVVLVTGVLFSISLCVRLYTKLDLLERRFDKLHEKLSIITSQKRD